MLAAAAYSQWSHYRARSQTEGVMEARPLASSCRTASTSPDSHALKIAASLRTKCNVRRHTSHPRSALLVPQSQIRPVSQLAKLILTTFCRRELFLTGRIIAVSPPCSCSSGNRSSGFEPLVINTGARDQVSRGSCEREPLRVARSCLICVASCLRFSLFSSQPRLMPLLSWVRYSEYMDSAMSKEVLPPSRSLQRSRSSLSRSATATRPSLPCLGE